jgi:hypothetical protein
MKKWREMLDEINFFIPKNTQILVHNHKIEVQLDEEPLYKKFHIDNGILCYNSCYKKLKHVKNIKFNDKIGRFGVINIY